MKQRLGTFFTADFETAPYDFDATKREDIVFSWTMRSSKGQLWVGIDLKSWVDCVVDIYLKNSKYGTKTIYFHNASKFDSHFIIKGLPILGWNQRKFAPDKKVVKILQESPYKTLNTVDKREGWNKNEYNIQIDGRGVIYKIEMSYEAPKTKKIGVIKVLDSKLLFKTSIKEMGEMLNTFNSNNKYTKGKIDFKQTPYKNIDEFKNDTERYKYGVQDSDILMEYLKTMSLFFHKNNWKTTIASTSYNWWKHHSLDLLEALYKKITGEVNWYEIQLGDYFRHWKWKDEKKPMRLKKHTDKLLAKILPMKKINENHNLIRWWFAGGICYLNPKKYGIIHKDNLYSYDVNSQYPAVMNSDLDYPIGEMVFGTKKGYNMKFYQLKALTDLENKKGLPFIFVISKKGSKFYPRIIPEGYEFNLTTPEYERFKKYYKGRYSKMVMFSFQTCKGKELFKKHVDYWYQKKEQNKNNPFETTISKILLNSLFGKFGSKSTKENKVFNHWKQGENWEKLNPADQTSWENEISINTGEYYLPISCLITAYGRMVLVDAVGLNGENLDYCDTDSLHFEGDLLDSNLIGKKIGQWKREITNGSGIFFQKKGYDIKDKYKHIQRLKSYHIDTKISIKDIIFGVQKIPYLRNKEVKWGKVLIPDFKELKPIWSEDKERPPQCWYKTKAQYLAYFNKHLKDLE